MYVDCSVVDKLLGVWKCSLELDMTDEGTAPASLLFKITTNSAGGPLTTGRLCQFIKNL